MGSKSKFAKINTHMNKFSTKNLRSDNTARVDELVGIDIEKEMELIAKKESKLTARTRKLVEVRHRFIELKKQFKARQEQEERLSRGQ